MYNINNGTNIKDILYSDQKITNNKNNYKNYTSELNKKYPPFPKSKASNKNKNKSLISEVKNMNNMKINNINSKYSSNDIYNKFNIKFKNNSKMMNPHQNYNINHIQNDNSSLYFQMNLNMKDNNKKQYTSIYSSSGKQKKFIRNLSEEEQIKKNNINLNYQKNSLRKDSSYINKILYNKNTNSNFYDIQDAMKNRIQCNINMNKVNINYKKILSKSSFNNSIHNIDNSTNNYNYINSNQNNNMTLNNNINNNTLNKNNYMDKSIKYQNSSKNIATNNKYKYKNNISNTKNYNLQIDKLKKYINKNNIEKILYKKNNINKNNVQLTNNMPKNDNNTLLKIKTNSYTPNNNYNCIFTSPNEDSQTKNYLIRNSLINENNDDFKVLLNETNKNKKINDKSCPKFNLNKNIMTNNNYTNINNINNNNNYIVNVNKYINIVKKKRKIIKKNSHNNGIIINNHNSYKIIDIPNYKKNSNKKYSKKEINIKNNNYINSPNNGFNFKKYKSVNENAYLPNSNKKYNKNNEDKNLNKNYFRTNTQTNNYGKNVNVTEFKKLKTLNYINRNNLKKNNYENKIYNSNIKKERFGSELKSSIIDYSNSSKYFNKSNTNSTIIKGFNNINNNGIYNNKKYNESFSSSTKKLNSSQRNSFHNYNFKTSINTIHKNSNNNKKGRNEKYNLGIIFKPQTKNKKFSKINSNRNPNINIYSRDSKTISIIEREKENFENKLNIKNNEYIYNNINNNFNLYKLMKTVNEYKNKNNKTKNNNIFSNKNINIKKSKSNYNTNIINKINNDDDNNYKNEIKNSYNSPISDMNLKFFNEKKISQNIKQNTLIMFSIYILSQHFTDFNKIGLSKIVLLNKNMKPIPVICSNNNCGKDTNKLFSIDTNKKNNDYNKPFITEFKDNIYINFYINNIQSNNIKYIQITNYIDIKNNISPVRKIEICQEKNLLYKGILNTNKVTIIKIPNYNKYEEIDNNSIQEIQDINDLTEINSIKFKNGNARPYSLTKYRSMEDEDNPNGKSNYIYSNSEYDNYYTTRGVLYKGFPNLIKNYKNKDVILDNKNNHNDNKNKSTHNNFNIKILLHYNNDNSGDGDYNINFNNFKNNDYELDSLLSQKLSLEFNKTNINTHNNTIKSNKIVKDNFDIYNTHNNSINKLSYSNSNNNINKTNSTLNNNNSNNVFLNLLKKTYNKNELDDFDYIFRTSINKMRDYSSFNLKSKSKKINSYIKQNNKNKINNNNLEKNSYDDQEESFSNINLYNDNMDNFGNNNIYNTIETQNFIEFNKIRFVISSNYGHHRYVGLTGIEFFNVKGESINIETALTIGALPKDLRTLYNDEKETRIFENVFNKINNTNDCDNMWVTRLKKNNPLPFIELFFKDKLRVSRIRIYNYNEKDKLNIGAKTIELYLDDEYYNTIHLKQGTGEIAFDFIKVKNNNKKNKENNEMYLDIDDSDISNNEDFGQDITFPMNDINQNEIGKFQETSNNNLRNSKISDLNEKEDSNKNEFKFASFLYKQSYETPYLPCGYHIKFMLSSNYYKGIAPFEENDSLKYNDIGFNRIEIYDEEGKNIINNDSNNSDNYINYKIISNCEICKNENEDDNLNNKIIINGTQNENGNNCIFYIFDKLVRISYIKFYPLKEDGTPTLNSAKEIKIFSDSKIIFEGTLHLDTPTIVLFTCEKKIINDIDENYLTKEINERVYKEEKTEDYISLIFN